MQKPRFNSNKKSSPKSEGPSRKRDLSGPSSSNRGKRGASSSERPSRGDSERRSSSDERPSRSSGTKSYAEKRGYGKEERPSRSSSSKNYSDRKSSYGDRDKPEKGYKVIGKDGKPQFKKTAHRKSIASTPRAPRKEGEMRLNKFLSNAGIASRRDADQLIQLGLVTVNGKVVTEMGYKVNVLTDTVKYDDKSLRPEKLRYVLLNKPKDYITTMEDPEERKTVMFLVKDACPERIYPVGRLDRQTTGLLLFTNDGELAKKLTHPRYGVQKLYHVETVERVKGTDLDAIRKGVKLEDGLIVPDEVAFVTDDQHQVGIKIHSGKNRVVRRIFEKHNYTVKKLDRVMFAGLTKKDLSRGRYRHLSEQEVAFLKMIK